MSRLPISRTLTRPSPPVCRVTQSRAWTCTSASSCGRRGEVRRGLTVVGREGTAVVDRLLPDLVEPRDDEPAGHLAGSVGAEMDLVGPQGAVVALVGEVGSQVDHGHLAGTETGQLLDQLVHPLRA